MRRRPATSIALSVLAAAMIAAGGVGASWGKNVPGPAPGEGCEHVRAGDACAVLFVGNSLTYVNDLPSMLHELAAGAGIHVWTRFAAGGGLRLADHVASTDTAKAIDVETWNVVVLQEQSAVPVFADLRAEMETSASTLVAEVREQGALPMLYMTWGRRDGLPDAGLGSYAAMQAMVEQAYRTIGSGLDVPVAPVGVAWSHALQAAPEVALWAPDGNHAEAAGTYLAACVFYATIFRRSPEGLPYTAELPALTAARLQEIAWRVVSAEAATGPR